MITVRCLLPGSLSFTSWSECVRELRNGKDTFSTELLNFLFRHAPKQTEIIFLHSLIMATLPELADLTMLVKD
jgi:hypothetical protein